MANLELQKLQQVWIETRQELIAAGIEITKAEEIAEAVHQYERMKLFGKSIKPQEGSRVCGRVIGYVCGGSDGAFHPECQNQPIYTYDQSKAVAGI